MKTVKKRSVVPIYLIGVVWLVYALLFPLYRISDYLICAALSLVAFGVGKSMFPTRTIELPEENTSTETKETTQAATSSLTPEQQELVTERDRAISELRRLNDNIKDPTISAQIDHMVVTTEKIFAYVLEHPEKKTQIRRFLNYYLPTTLKLLNAYDRMDNTGVSGANIDGTKGKIEQMLASVVSAFDKQLDALFSEEALDISADITVLEHMMAQEGLTENADFKTAQS
jgi:hypothetical protein